MGENPIDGVRPLRVNLGERSYRIVFAADRLRGLPEALARVLPQRQVAIITTPVVARLYAADVGSGLSRIGFSPVVIQIPDGESAKRLSTVERVVGRLLAEGLDRDCVILALGGGVVGDLAGFVAAIYLRGVAYVQVPTTLLAQVDSAVGGKTGVNHRRGKNLIGSFYQPRLVYADLRTLNTLPERELRAGMAEVIKYGVIRDGKLFERLEKEMPRLLRVDVKSLAPVVRRSCQIKAAVVAADEREAGLRAILNFGHTFGHAIEAMTGYRAFKHGEAVAVGMNLAANTSHRLGLCSREVPARIRDLILAAGLPVKPPVAKPAAWKRAVMADKKRRGGSINFVAVRGIGRCEVRPIPLQELLGALDLVQR
jgi:3-dehydroquinate synthase